MGRAKIVMGDGIIVGTEQLGPRDAPSLFFFLPLLPQQHPQVCTGVFLGRGTVSNAKWVQVLQYMGYVLE